MGLGQYLDVVEGDPRAHNQQDVAAFVAHVNENPDYKHSTVAVIIRGVRAFFDYLRRSGRDNLRSSQARSDPKRPRISSRRYVPTESDMEKLLNAPDINTNLGVRDRCIMEVFYGSGLRLSELCSLQLSDVRLDQGELEVRKAKVLKTESFLSPLNPFCG